MNEKHPAGAILAAQFGACMLQIYGARVPVEDVAVATSAILRELFALLPPDVADIYRAFVIEALMEGVTRQ